MESVEFDAGLEEIRRLDQLRRLGVPFDEADEARYAALVKKAKGGVKPAQPAQPETPAKPTAPPTRAARPGDLPTAARKRRASAPPPQKPEPAKQPKISNFFRKKKTVVIAADGTKEIHHTTVDLGYSSTFGSMPCKICNNFSTEHRPALIAHQKCCKAKADAAAAAVDAIDAIDDEPGPPVAEAAPVLATQPLDVAPSPMPIPPVRQSYALPIPFTPPPAPPQVARKLKKDGGEKATRGSKKRKRYTLVFKKKFWMLSMNLMRERLELPSFPSDMEFTRA